MLDPRLRAPLLLGLGALLPLLRVLPDPTHRLPGTELSDVFKHTWSYWHATQVLGSPRTELLNHSEGGLLLDLMWGPSLLMSPITALLGPVLAANLWIWLSLTMVGLASWYLARQLVGEGPGALLGGLAAQTALPLMGYPLLSGVHERLAVWLFPVLVSCLFVARERGGWRAPLIAGLSLFWVTLGCQAYGLYAAGMLLLGLPLWLGHPRRWWHRFKRLAPTGLALLAAAGLAFWLCWSLTVHPEALVPQPGRLSGEGPRLVLESASLAAMLNPAVARATQPTLGGDELYVLSYLGWASLILAVVGSALHRGERRWWVRGSTALALLMALFALGPRFTVGGQGFMDPLFLAVAALLPYYGENPPVWQHVLAVAPLLAPGLAAAVQALPRWRWPAVVAALALILAERAWAFPKSLVLPVAEARVPALYEAIGEEGAVAEVPRFYLDHTTTHGGLFLAQTVHEQPVSFTIDIGHSPWDSYLPLARGVSGDWRQATSCLREAGFRYLVLHRDHYSRSEQAERALSELARHATLLKDDGTRALFDLGPATGPLRLAGPPVSRSSMELVGSGLIGRPVDRIEPAWERCPAQ